MVDEIKPTMTANERIQMYKDTGIPEDRIAEYFRAKFKNNGIGDKATDAWLNSQGIIFEGKYPAGGGVSPSRSPRAEIDPYANKPKGDLQPSDFLPALGSAAFDIATAGRGGVAKTLGAKALNLAKRAGGVGAGGMFGSMAEQAVEGRPFSPKETLEEGAWATGSELALSPLVAAAKRLYAPAKDKVTDLSRSAMQLAKDAGLPVSKSRFVDGAIPKMWQVLSDYTPAGRMITNKYRDTLIDQSTKRAQSFAKNMGFDDAVMPKDTIGKRIGETFDPDFKSIYQPYKDALRMEAKKNGGFIYMDESAQALGELKNMQEREVSKLLSGTTKEMHKNTYKIADNEVIKKFGYSPASEQGKMIKAFLYNEEVTPHVIEDLLGKVFKGWDAKLSTTRAAREKFKELLLKDLDNIRVGVEGETAGSIKAAADKVFGETKELMKKSPTLNYITGKYRNSPGLKFYQAEGELVVDKLWDKGLTDELMTMKTQILKEPDGQKLWAGLQFHWLQGIVKKSMKQDDVTGQLVLKPMAFFEQISAKKDTLRKLMPESWPKIEKEVELYKNIAPDFKARNAQSPWVVGTLLSGGGAVGGGPLLGVVVPNGFGALTAWNLMGKNGKWLSKETIGTTAKVVGHTVKQPTRAGMQLLEEQ